MANPLAKRKTTDWTLCCFCQLKSSEILKHPYLKSCYTTRHTLVFKITLINLLKTISHSIWLEHRLITEDWNCISKSLLNHKAVYHKTCDKIRPHIVNRVLNKRWCEDSDSHGTSSSPRKTRKSVGSGGDSADKSQCVYCNTPQTGNSEPLCKAMTDNVSKSLKQMAKDAENWVVYVLLNAVFDATAGDLCYQKTCYCKLSDQAGAKKQKSEATASNPPYDPLVMAELIAYIQPNNNAIRLSDLKKLYSQRLQQVGAPSVYIQRGSKNISCRD